MSNLLIKNFEMEARTALAEEIVVRTGDKSVNAENIVGWLNINISDINADGSEIVNAWEHAYIAAKFYSSSKSSFLINSLGIYKEIMTSETLQFSKDALKDIYNNEVGIKVAKVNPNMDEVRKQLFDMVLTVENNTINHKNNPGLVLYENNDTRIYSSEFSKNLAMVIVLNYNFYNSQSWNNLFREAQSIPAVYRDPLLIDLNGDGIKTTTIENGTYFDHDNNGYAEKTSWVDQNDGIFVYDKNNNGIIENGTEVMGDSFIKSDGTTAANGFEALKSFDSNNDNVINASDEEFANIKILKGDGSLITLAEAGIVSISLSASSVYQTDENGNMQLRVSSYTKSDGSTHAIGDYNFVRDPLYSVSTEYIDVPEDILDLPDAKGYGVVETLQQAMAKDTSGELKNLVQSFINETNLSAKRDILTNIIYKWAGVENLDSTSRGEFVDARVVAALEKFTAKDYNGLDNTNCPNIQAASYVNSAFATLKETVYAQLVSQTSLKSVYDLITLDFNIETEQAVLNLSAVKDYIMNQITADKQNGDNLLSDFDRTFKNLGLKDTSNYQEFYNAFVQLGDSYKSLLDTSDKFVVYGTSGEDSINGNSSDEAFFAGAGNDTIYARQGNDIVYGEDGDDYIDVCEGDDIVYGGSGNDTIIGGEGKDALYGDAGDDSINGTNGSNYIDGGAGNDVIVAGGLGHTTIIGGLGDDTMTGQSTSYSYSRSSTTYIYNVGDGDDTLILGAGDNYIELGEGLTKENILIQRTGNDRIITFTDTAGSIRLNNVPTEIRFTDGTKLTSNELEQMYTKHGTDEDDIIEGSGSSEKIYGYGGNDTITADNGNDTIYGGAGNDSIDGYGGTNYIDGGAGNDIITAGWNGNTTIIGGLGDDTMTGQSYTYLSNRSSATYIYNAGDGNDMINLGQGENYIEFGEGITKENILIQRTGDERIITFTDIAGSIKINGVPTELRFTDGTKVTSNEFEQMYTKHGTDENDIIDGSRSAEKIYGYGGNDTIKGDDGNDTIYGGAGDDSINGTNGSNYIDGGAGNDVLIAGGLGDTTIIGGLGDDTMTGQSYTYLSNRSSATYIYNVGDGNDTINTGQGNNYIEFGEGITKDNIRFERTGASGRLITFKGINGSIYSYGLPSEVRFADGTKYTENEIEKLYAIYGTEGDDLIDGSQFGVKIYGYEGNDTINAGDGNDTVYGGAGDDSIEGTTGNNYLDGGEGDDFIYGGARGYVTIVGGLGDDTLMGQSFSNRYFVGSSEFVYNAGDGNDTIYLGPGNNYISFNEGITKDNIIISKDTENNTIITFNGFDGSLKINGVPNQIKFIDGTNYNSDEISSLRDNQSNNQVVLEMLNPGNNLAVDINENSSAYVSNSQINRLIQDMTAFSGVSDADISTIQMQKNNEDLLILAPVS